MGSELWHAWGGSQSCPVTGTIQKPEIILKKAVCSKIKYKIRVKLFLKVDSMKVDTTMTSDFESAHPFKPKKARYQSFFTVWPLKGLKPTISGLNGYAVAMSKYDVTMRSFVNFCQVFLPWDACYGVSGQKIEEFDWREFWLLRFYVSLTEMGALVCPLIHLLRNKRCAIIWATHSSFPQNG